MSLKQGARLTAFLLIVAFVIWAIYLLIVGLPGISVPEIRPGESPVPGQTTNTPYLGAAYSLLALLIVAIGLLRDKWLPIAWLGVLLHLAFGGLLIWGLGILYIGVAGTLAVLVGILQWQVSRQVKWVYAAWAGNGVVLLTGLLLSGTAYGLYILVLGVLLGLVLFSLQRNASTRLPA
jgi:hypothetical protein